MTVKELIAILRDMKDKEVNLVIDCPHCGHSNEVKKVQEVVLIGTVADGDSVERSARKPGLPQ